MFLLIDPHVLYTTANFLFKSTDGGNHWETISPDLARKTSGIPPSVGAMASADPKNAAKAEKQRGVIYALAPSFRGVLGTRFLGRHGRWLHLEYARWRENWSNITPPELKTPWSKVTQLCVAFR